MDYLQYIEVLCTIPTPPEYSFKPYYKWITFNTRKEKESIWRSRYSFKPYYKWITFNTKSWTRYVNTASTSFKPYYKWITFNTGGNHENFRCICWYWVLNLIINGLPSIHYAKKYGFENYIPSFKPYYKWITFNTVSRSDTLMCLLCMF